MLWIFTSNSLWSERGNYDVERVDKKGIAKFEGIVKKGEENRFPEELFELWQNIKSHY